MLFSPDFVSIIRVNSVVIPIRSADLNIGLALEQFSGGFLSSTGPKHLVALETESLSIGQMPFLFTRTTKMSVTDR